MKPFSCPTCGSETWKLIAARDSYESSNDKIVCPNCFHTDTPRRVGLQDSFPGSQSKGLTNGKAWEIENRVRCPDDPKVWINKKTGKETQY